MTTDEEIEKIKEMTKEEKMAYLENRIDEILLEMPAEDKQAIISVGPDMMMRMFSGENIEMMEQMMSGEGGEFMSNMMEQMCGPEMMEQMMSGEGGKFMGKIMEQMGDPEKMRIFMNISEESQEKLAEIRKLGSEIIGEMSSEDYAELMQRIHRIYDKHMEI
ncbi:MAG: hypothetical protein ACETWM_22435 [Candidatus Lokiarchaeia archaeon]